MASVKFLEEALSSTDVDESAVSALVGSLENQLVTTTPIITSHQVTTATVNQSRLNSPFSNGDTVSTQNHGVSNGVSEARNIIINSNSNNKPVIAGSHQSGNVLPANVTSNVTSFQGNVPSSSYVNQVTSNVGLVQSNIKSQEALKVIYCNSVTSGVNRTFQSVGSIPNGNIGLTTLSSQNVSNSNQKIMQGPVTASMTVNSTMTLTGSQPTAVMGQSSTSAVPGIVTFSKPLNQVVGSTQTIVGNSSQTILPANLQFVNVNTIRAGVGNQPGQKTITQRVMIPQMIGARPGSPGGQITLQAMPGLAGASPGSHILLKTENGQIQLLRVGPAAAGTPLAASNATSTCNTPSFRIQTVPTQAITGAGGAVQTVVPALTTTQSPTTQPPVAKTSTDTTKEKCRKFLANLLELSSREPKAVERNVRKLIQELVDTKVEPEEFCDRLEKLLNASPQPCLIGFLKKNLPLLRQSMIAKELVIDGIRPPPASVLFAHQTPATVVQQIQTQVANQIRPAVQVSNTPQMRVVAQPTPTAVKTVTPLQHRLVTPVRVQTPSKVGTTTVTIGGQQTTVATNASMINCLQTPPVRNVTPVRAPVQKTIPAKSVVSTQAAVRPSIAITATTAKQATFVGRIQPVTTTSSSVSKPQAPSLVPKTVTTVREKKTFSTSYTGDDDINDVAAMGGVNLAEETQRILGSTEFVGTQIRSCKDDMYLHSHPLMKRIREIASSHGLEEPTSDVAALVSHATQERLKNLVEKLAVIAEHRIDFNKADWRYEVSQDVRGQLKFLEELDRVERRRHDEMERELLLRAAKSRSKSEDPEQAKLKAKAKEMQRAEMEELRQREANYTALQAIGPRKRPKLEVPKSSANSLTTPGSDSPQNSSSSVNRPQLASRPRLKRVNMRDFLFLLEQEKETCRSSMLYSAYLK